MLLSLIYRLDLIKNNPNPQLDCYQLLKYAPLLLLQGKNPYSEDNEYPRIKLADGSLFKIPAYSYGITPLLLLVPNNYLFKDPRYFFVLTELLTVLVIFKILRENKNKFSLNFLFPILYYWHPLSLYVITQGFLEPLMLFLLILPLYLYYKNKINLSLLSFALLINVKQTLFIVPFFLKKLKISQVVKLVGFISILIIPFFIWSPRDFLKFGLIYQYIDTNLAPIRLSTLTFNSLFYNFFGSNFPQILFFLIWLLTFIFILKYQNKKYANIYFSLSLFYTVLSFFNYYSYNNYYYFSSLLILIGLIWNIAENK
ncbi:MAG: hypothetical protein NC935_05080 [Candidatus Omnitrophica bacterium]|nr:hypothetical protein [Candidatus Omnitrophota bacterium]